jgi:dimethylhistidine N-methyltransferase
MELLQGLRAPQKFSAPKYLYDDEGSRLFEQICKLEEYYPTRTEISILREHGRALREYLSNDAVLVELGSGASLKTRVVLDAAPGLVAYVPIDISRETLMNSAAQIRTLYPRLKVTPVCADYTRPFALPAQSLAGASRRIFLFPGSTIGNFNPLEARNFLRRLRELAGEESTYLIVGVDTLKDRSTLERAYNDSKGVTAAFNRNLLVRLNREYGADFEVDDFVHEALFNRRENRVEMHLRAIKSSRVNFAGEEIYFEAGESLHTESSYKYSLEGFRLLAKQSGWKPLEMWTDARRLFSVHLLTVDTKYWKGQAS